MTIVIFFPVPPRRHNIGELLGRNLFRAGGARGDARAGDHPGGINKLARYRRAQGSGTGRILSALLAGNQPLTWQENPAETACI